MDSGATYDTWRVGNYSISYMLSAHCPANNKVKLVGTRAAEMPQGYKPQMSDIPRMVKLRASGGILAFSCGVMCSYGAAPSGYDIDGFVLTTDHAIATGGGSISVANLVLDGPFPGDQYLPHDIDFHHVISTNGEEELFGPLEYCKTIECTLRSNSMGIVIAGNNVLIEDSAVYGSGGFLPVPAPTYPVTSGTNTDPAAVASPGIAAILGIGPEQNGNSTNPVTGKPWCNYANAFYAAPHSCAMVIVEGTPPGWDAASGVKWAIYKTPDSVYLVPPTFNEMLAPWLGLTIDTTAAPGWSGTARIRPVGPKLDPVYNLAISAGSGIRLINNYFENGDMTVFMGGGTFATSTGTVAASTFDPATQISTVTLTDAVGDAKMGDILAAAAPGVSKWCGPTGISPSANVCYQGGTRTGRITAISGTRPNLTFSMLPVGPLGIDTNLTIGKMAQWEGLNLSRIAMIRNRIVRNPDAFQNGKGPFESKDCETCLFDGNSIDGVIFFEAKNGATGGTGLGAGIPWTTFSHVTVRNNGFWVGGRATINANDYEATTTQAKNTWFENNFFSGGGAGWEQQNDINSGFRHNTVAGPDPAVTAWNYVNNSGIPLPCGHQASDGMPYLDDYDKLYGLIYDNIVPYNHGLAHGDTGCWPNEATAVHHNVFIQGILSGDPDTTAIGTSWPNNMPVPNLAAVGMVNPGTLCTQANWRSCALASSSAYKGAASDGKDIGADTLEVDDHLNGWSEAAGLIRYENLTATYEPNPAAFNLGATHAAIKFRAYGAPCSLVLYTDRARQIIHGDTSTSGRQDCARAGNSNQDGVVSFSLGTNVVLTADTLYAYQITTGTRVMVGEFRTASRGTP